MLNPTVARLRQAVAQWLRFRADEIDPDGAPRLMSTCTFTFEVNEGIRFREDGRGCRLWYMGRSDYDKAFTESDTRPPRVNWESMTLEDYGDNG